MRETLLPESRWPEGMAEPLRTMLRTVVSRMREIPEVLGLAAGGSFISGRMDEYSDLDLVVMTVPDAWDRVMASRKKIAESMGPLLAAFTGEHVGEPRLLICLYGPPPVHVDLKFITPEMLASRVEDPVILWDRAGGLAEALLQGTAHYPQPSLQWTEDRFWVWVHYVCTKLARGELLETLDCLAFLRARVLGPLALRRASAQPTGVRHIERDAPALAERMAAAVARHDARDMLRALRVIVSLYRELREGMGDPALERRPAAEAAAMDFLETVSSRVDSR